MYVNCVDFGTKSSEDVSGFSLFAVAEGWVFLRSRGLAALAPSPHVKSTGLYI